MAIFHLKWPPLFVFLFFLVSEFVLVNVPKKPNVKQLRMAFKLLLEASLHRLNHVKTIN